MIGWISILCPFAAPALAQQVHGPRLVVEERTHDFGTVQEGQVIEHTFPVLNQGNAPLEIVRVSPG